MRNMTKKVTSVDPFVYLLSAGVKLIATRKPSRLATMLINPQLIVSPTPSCAVYSTASSYATNKIGSKKKPKSEHDT